MSARLTYQNVRGILRKVDAAIRRHRDRAEAFEAAARKETYSPYSFNSKRALEEHQLADAIQWVATLLDPWTGQRPPHRYYRTDYKPGEINGYPEPHYDERLYASDTLKLAHHE